MRGRGQPCVSCTPGTPTHTSLTYTPHPTYTIYQMSTQSHHVRDMQLLPQEQGEEAQGAGSFALCTQRTNAHPPCSAPPLCFPYPTELTALQASATTSAAMAMSSPTSSHDVETDPDVVLLQVLNDYQSLALARDDKFTSWQVVVDEVNARTTETWDISYYRNRLTRMRHQLLAKDPKLAEDIRLLLESLEVRSGRWKVPNVMEAGGGSGALSCRSSPAFH